MEQGYLAIVLHAHLPYVHHPEHEDALEENWLFEAITETYVPVFLVLEELLEDDIDFRLTFSVSATLASMLADPFLQSRYLRKLERQIELAAKEEVRTKSDPVFHPLARMYGVLLARVREAFENRYQKNLLNGFRRFQELGKVELMATAATHGYLPLLSVNESAVRAQIKVGVERHQRNFGVRPAGFWLPECGYYPGVDTLLAEQGIRFTILETHGITRADQRPRYGVYAPIYCPSGVAAFGRDPDSSRQVWSSIEGYPGDYDYREFYRDIGYDLDMDYIRPYIHRDGIRIDTGMKYYRITGKDNYKEPYVPEWAERKAEIHASHFLAERQRQVERLSSMMDRKPVIVAPYDAELFGHWWFEGPRWLDYLIRKSALEQDTMRLATLSECLNEYPENQTATPSMSSWGYKGFSDVWLNPENHWIYPHLHAAARNMEELAHVHAGATGLLLRALNQAARELLLAQASDWAFMIGSRATTEYATARTKSHLSRFLRLKREIESQAIDEAWLTNVEAQDQIFPDDGAFEPFRKSPPAAALGISEAAPPEQPAPEAPRAIQALPSSLHVVMVCPEVVPFARTGGLGDVVGSLAIALQRLGQRVSLIMPAYASVLQGKFELRDTGIRVTVPLWGRREEAQVLVTMLGDEIPVYLIRADRYFDREYLYTTPQGDYSDNAERFAFFSRAALEVLREIDTPDILHAHDWQAALAITFLKAQPERYPGLASVRTVLTVHNLGYQGLFSPQDWGVLDLDSSLFSAQGLEFYQKINFLKGGLVFANALTTVSPTYAQEIRTPENGFGLEGVFQQRAADLAGILNGVDYEVWSPATDPFIARNYTSLDLSGKSACKADLQEAFGLSQKPNVPLIGVVSRLAPQKGLDLIEAATEDLLQRDLQFVLLGTGESRWEDYFRSVAARKPGKVGVKIAFEDELAHKIEAGADMFLMPSRYEPGGLNQLYSLKYGTIPVVRATGGLKDSIEEFDPAAGTGNGFVFDAYDVSELLAALDRALATFRHRLRWAALMRSAMAADYSWGRSARGYLALYERLLGARTYSSFAVRC
ncbi:MAG: glycogen synthase GlgA [Bryobacteraceae bacterium]